MSCRMCMHFKILIFYLPRKKCKDYRRQKGRGQEMGKNQRPLQKYKYLVVRGENTLFFERPSFSLLN